MNNNNYGPGYHFIPKYPVEAIEVRPNLESGNSASQSKDMTNTFIGVGFGLFLITLYDMGWRAKFSKNGSCFTLVIGKDNC